MNKIDGIPMIEESRLEWEQAFKDIEESIEHIGDENGQNKEHSDRPAQHTVRSTRKTKR